MDDVKTPWNQPLDVPRPEGPSIESVMHDFFTNLRRVAIAALVKTEIDETEKFALCWASGVPIKFEDGKFKTEVKCSVVRIDDQWKIFQGNSRGECPNS